MILEHVKFYYNETHKWLPPIKHSVIELSNVEAEEVDEKYIHLKNGVINSHDMNVDEFKNAKQSILMQINYKRPIEVYIDKVWFENERAFMSILPKTK